jgi:hypothetical protein
MKLSMQQLGTPEISTIKNIFRKIKIPKNFKLLITTQLSRGLYL